MRNMEKQIAENHQTVLKTKLDKMQRHGLFSAFIPEPQNVKFETQEDDEKVLLLLRKHVITNVPWILISILLILIPLAVPFFPFINFLPARFIPIILIGWYLLVFVYIFKN